MEPAALMSPFARAALLTALAAPLASCVTDANRCLPGFTYSAGYDACLANAGPSDGGSESSTEAASPADGSSAGDAGAGGDSGLGIACMASSNCAGAANYCLKDPTAPSTSPGFCSIPGCTAAECGSAYACCDCTAAVIAALSAWPKNLCAPAANKSTLVQFGCTCQ